MDQPAYNTLTALIFSIVALAHLLRAIFGWQVQIGGVEIPLWVSWLALIVAAALAWFGFRQNRVSTSAAG